jgi:hypothetical protein
MVRVKTLAAKYVENWKVHWEHSEVYQGREREERLNPEEK